MKSLTPNAQEHLDGYLRQVKAALKPCPSVDAEDVQRDIRQHIAGELEDKQQPVSLDELDAVLKKLGMVAQNPDTPAPWPGRLAPGVYILRTADSGLSAASSPPAHNSPRQLSLVPRRPIARRRPQGPRPPKVAHISLPDHRECLPRLLAGFLAVCSARLCGGRRMGESGQEFLSGLP